MKEWLSRSWLFEVVDIVSEIVEKSFTLVLPPQQYSIKEKARVSITKTFGNAFIDDYGADNIEITIKGISGTSHVFPTFDTSGKASTGQPFNAITKGFIAASTIKAMQGYDARSAFYTFRNDIMRYRDLENFDRKELRVYDLHDEQAYRCVLLEFNLDRTSDKPFYYPFTIHLFVIARLDSKKAAKAKVIKIGFDPFQLLDSLDASLAWLHTAYRFVKDVQNQIALVTAAVQTLRYRFNIYLSETREIIESPLRAIKQVLSLIQAAGGLAYDAYSQSKLTFKTWANTREIIEGVTRDTLKMYGFAIQEGSQESKERLLPKDAGSQINDDGTTDRITELESFSFTGVNMYTVKGRDTLQSIALKEMGNVDLWPYIAYVNDIQGNNELIVASSIYIPVTVEGEINKDNYIMTEDFVRDPYGADIRIDKDGNIIVAESNDVSLISGLNNVKQALDLRLSTAVGSMIKQTAYGLIGQPGIAGTELALKYVRMGIKAALMKDPRIEDVKNIYVTVDGDVVQANMDISIIGSDKTLPTSAVL